VNRGGDLVEIFWRERDRICVDPAVDLADVRAPTIAPVTPFHVSVQAIAMAEIEVPWRLASGRSESRNISRGPLHISATTGIEVRGHCADVYAVRAH
jgi:hypothetical protein